MSLAPLPVHNENASLASLARTVLSCVDRRRLEIGDHGDMLRDASAVSAQALQMKRAKLRHV